MNFDNWINESKPAFLSPSLEKIKRCVNCGSVFISEQACESCGFQFTFDPLGEPLGEKSFFAIKEDYLIRQKSFFENKLNLKKSYWGRVLRRLEILLLFFSKSDLNLHPFKNKYFAELIFIIQEMSINYDFDYTLTRLQELNNQEMQDYLIEIALAQKQKIRKDSDIIRINLFKFFILSLTLALLIVTSLALYPLIM